MMIAPKTYFNTMLNALFPPQCMCCGELVKTHGTLCHGCWAELHFITAPHCTICAHPFEYDLGEGALCASCIDALPSFTSAYSAVVYDDTSKRLLHKLKFEDQGHLAPIFADWLANHMQARAIPDIIIPVPLSKKRLFTRRYNQSALVAKELALSLGIAYQPHALQRIKHTAPQTGLNKTERQENIRGAFAISASHSDMIKGASICLIDDVMTTGATIDACTATLNSAGASAVHVLTIARVVRGM